MIHLRDLEAIRSAVAGCDDRDIAYLTPKTRAELVDELWKLISELKNLSDDYSIGQISIGLYEPKPYSNGESE